MRLNPTLAALLAVGAALAGPISVVPAIAAQPSAPETSVVGFDTAKLAALDTAFSKAVEEGQVVGVTYLVSRHGKVAAFKSIGMASIKRGQPLSNDAVFRIFSMTKPITGVALMLLYEQGKWKLDDPITRFLPEFANLKVVTGVDASGAPITVPVKRPPTMRELMSHTAGFGYGLFPGNPVDDLFRARKVTAAPNLAEVAHRVSDIPLKFQPGEGWSYSIAADLQARIVEVISGESFGDFLDHRILKPLGMKDTAFYVSQDRVPRFTDLYAMVPATGKLAEVPPTFAPQLSNFTDPHRQQSGGGGLVSTASDYGRFCQMILNHGELDGVRLLKPESLALMGEDVIPPGVQPDKVLVQAMGTSAFAFGQGVGFGLDFMVINDPKVAHVPVGRGTLSWGGAAGTWFWVDPANDLYFIGMIQRLAGSGGKDDLPGTSQKIVYDALTRPQD